MKPFERFILLKNVAIIIQI